MKNTIIRFALLFVYLKVTFAVSLYSVPKISPSISGHGKQWPIVRFTSQGGNCILDHLTGLMWAKNGTIGFFNPNDPTSLLDQPDYNNSVEAYNMVKYPQNNDAITKLNQAPIKLCGYSDWRVPQITELLSLSNYEYYELGLPNSNYLNSNGFMNIRDDNGYWSSTAANISEYYVSYQDSNYNNFVLFNTNFQGFLGGKYLLPVRGGK